MGGRAKKRFLDLVGFVSDSKNQKLAAMLAKQQRSEPFAMPGVVREVLRNLKTAHRDAYGDIPSLWKKRAPAFTANGDAVSAATLREIVQDSKTQTIDSERLLAFLQQDLTLEEVVSVKSLGVRKTYDIVDSRSGMVVADGLVVSQSLNFNMYTDLFPLVEQSVKKGYKIGLISQRIDMLAETPEQVVS